MTTPTEAQEAPRQAQKQRFGLRHLLRVNPAGASADDLALADKVRTVPTPEAYDRFMIDLKVADLFRRGVLFFGGSDVV